MEGWLISDCDTADELVLELSMVAEGNVTPVLLILVEVLSVTRVARAKTKYLSVVVLPVPPKPALTDKRPVALIEMTVV